MNTYNTGNPLGSTAPKDLYDNASNFDEAMNAPSPSFVDRFGKRRETWAGMQEQVVDFLNAMGFEPIHLTYVDGSPLVVNRSTQLIDRAGSVYKVKTPATFPVNLTGNWATDSDLLVDVSDMSLRAELAAGSGAQLVGFQAAGSGAIVRDLLARGRDSVHVEDFGAVGDGVTDDFAAIQAAHIASPFVDYGAKTYVSLQKVVVNGPFGFSGRGIGQTIIDFKGPTQGFVVNQASSAQSIVCQGATFRTNSASTTTVGLLLDGSAQYAGDDSQLRIIGDRTSYRACVEHMDFRGTSTSTGWGVNLQFKSIINFSAQNIMWSGVVPSDPATGTLQGVGILVNGNGAVIDFSIRRIWGYYTLYGVLMPDYLEGGHIYDYELVAVIFGIVSRYTAGHSVLPAALCGSLGMHIAQGHLNVLNAGILLDKTNQCHIVNQNIYLQTRAVDAPGLCVQITSGNWNTIHSVFCNGDSAGNTHASNLGVVLTAVGLSDVRNISASSVSSAVTLQGSSTNDIGECRAAFCTSVVSTDGASTGNRIAAQRGQSNSGAPITGSDDNIFAYNEFTSTFVQAFASQTSFTLNVTVPAGTFYETPKFGMIIADSGSIAFNFQYVISASTPTLAKFFVTPQPPATNLGAASVQFSVNLKGL